MLLIFVVFFGAIIVGWEFRKQSYRYIEKQIAKTEYKIKIARKEKRIEYLKYWLDFQEWKLERAIWIKEWNSRKP